MVEDAFARSAQHDPTLPNFKHLKIRSWRQQGDPTLPNLDGQKGVDVDAKEAI